MILKKQSIFLKIIISICFILGTINLWSFYDPFIAFEIIESWEILDMINRILGLFYAIAVIITLIRIWKNTKCEKEERNMWFFLTILFPLLFGTIYIWSKENEISSRSI
ncbi:hypothetical protein ERX46_02750 [Brumimicrobium glaciale]|uniref:Uncharacterized protein n=1 Tax=Brumimicrobium glaciale TaxID=200475 RepID=A0A4Q4KQY1_9FLAO|nr:hypothetical protein [Brumimicrobium glaciale]RYM35930.1 hypothetical protein ERX46_02750 [Brumimicrobium glaciale]